MRAAKKLCLKKEALNALTGDELVDVAGAQNTPLCLSNYIYPCPVPPTRYDCTIVSRIIDPCLTYTCACD